MATAVGVRQEERWGAGAEEDGEYSREGYRGIDRRDGDDRTRREDHYRGREERSRREDYSRGRYRRDGEERDRRGGDERSRREGEERPRSRRDDGERSRRDGDDSYRGDEERRRETGDRGERRRRDEDEPLEKAPEMMPEKVSVPEKVAGRSGGVYIPPFKLAQMMKEVDDKCSVQYQRMTWDALRKSINGLVNKVSFFGRC